MAYFEETVIEQLLAQAEIVEVIGHYLTLQKRGQNFLASCPFHQEKTPSFTVSSQKQIFYCFGCGTGGNALKFIQLKEKMNFPEAMEKLAALVHFNLPELNTSATTPRYQELYQLSEWTADHYHRQLLSQKPFLQAWLSQRRLQPVTIDLFKLGYAPESWDFLAQQAQHQSKNLLGLTKLGLISQGKNGQYYDRFRDRIIFPIHNSKGKIIAFGGRILKQATDQAKYLNSPETPIFHKSDNLFGLWHSQNEIRQQRWLYLVEGYMDYLSLYQAGIKNVIASLGTALTIQHAKRIKQLVNLVYIMYDSDPAGMKAAYRASEIFLSQGINHKIILLNTNEDPDSLVTSQGVAAIQEKNRQAIDALDYRWSFLKKNLPPSDSAHLITTMIGFIKSIQDPIQRELHLDSVTQITEISRTAISEKLTMITGQHAPRSSGTLIHPAEIRPEERILLKLLIQQPGKYLHRIRQDLPLILFEHPIVSATFQAIFDLALINDIQIMSMPQLIHHFEKPEQISLISSLSFEELNQATEEIAYRQCVFSLKTRYLDKEIKRVQALIKTKEKNQDQTGIDHLLRKFEQLIDKKKEILHEKMGQ